MVVMVAVQAVAVVAMANKTPCTNCLKSLNASKELVIRSISTAYVYKFWFIGLRLPNDFTAARLLLLRTAAAASVSTLLFCSFTSSSLLLLPQLLNARLATFYAALQQPTVYKSSTTTSYTTILNRFNIRRRMYSLAMRAIVAPRAARPHKAVGSGRSRFLLLLSLS